MAHALNIRSDDQSSIKIEQLWHDCGALELIPSMRNLGYRPHITFAIYDDYDLNILRHVFETTFKFVRKIAIRFDRLRMFDGADSLVVWANPVRPEEIWNVHRRIHELIDENLCRDHYKPKNWVPHCSVGMSIPLDRKVEAMKLVDRRFDSFEVIFDVADLVSFSPVQIEEEMALIEAD